MTKFLSTASSAARKRRAAGQPVRADDNEESLKIRLMEYYKKTSPLIGYYYHAGDLKLGGRTG